MQREERTAALYALSRDLVARRRRRRRCDGDRATCGGGVRRCGVRAAAGRRRRAARRRRGAAAARRSTRRSSASRNGRTSTASPPGSAPRRCPDRRPCARRCAWRARSACSRSSRDRATRCGAEQREFLDAFCRQAAFALERARLSPTRRAAPRCAPRPRRCAARCCPRSRTTCARRSRRSPARRPRCATDARLPGRSARRAARRDLRRGRAARAPGREPARHDAARVGRGRAQARLGAGRGDRRLGARRGSSARLTGRPVRHRPARRLAAGLGRPGAVRAGAGQPARERGQVHARGHRRSTIARAQRRRASVVIEVRDRGPGLPPGDEQRVFEKFYRGGQAGDPRRRARPADLQGDRRGARRRDRGAKTGTGGGAVFRVTLPLVGRRDRRCRRSARRRTHDRTRLRSCWWSRTSRRCGASCARRWRRTATAWSRRRPAHEAVDAGDQPQPRAGPARPRACPTATAST